MMFVVRRLLFVVSLNVMIFSFFKFANYLFLLLGATFIIYV